jgi:Bacterial Ig-like domain (group 3)
MKIRVKKTWAAAVGLALAATTFGGVALAVENPSGWYTGGNATVVDPDRTAVALRLYDAAGNQVSSGSTTTQLAAFAAADGPVRAGDDYASLFVHLPQSSTAPGAWPGVQATGTSKFTGAGAVAAPSSLAGKPYVATSAGGYTLADVVAGLPNNETGASYAKVYELRLRSSSATAGVSNQYAAAYVRISGTTWTLTSSPVLGDSTTPPAPAAVGTSVAVTWPRITYGKAAAVVVTVKAAWGAAKPSGTVTLVTGSRTLSSVRLTSAGTATLTVAKTALAPGSRSLKVTYAGVANAFVASQSAPKTIQVAKGATGTPTLKVVKKPTGRKGGAATVKVPTTTGLAKAGGKVTVVLKKGKKSKKVTATIRSGSATVKLPKLPKGTWTATVVYLGDSYYTSSRSKAVRVKVK